MPAVPHSHNHVPDPIALILAQARGGVAPSRHEVALSDYLAEQMRHREGDTRHPRISQLGEILWRLIGRGTNLVSPTLEQSKPATKL